VEDGYRNQGIGSRLLTRSEELIRANGHKRIKLGVGFDYFMPGVPTSKRYADAVNECLDERVNEDASLFFEAHGYKHSQDCNIFDMRFPLKDFVREEYSVGDTIDGITYRFATESDRKAVYDCTDDALKEFTQWYKSDDFYCSEVIPKVLIATEGDIVCGALLVEIANEKQKLGTVGCTSVRRSCRGRKIATHMVTLGTKYLRDIGMKDAFLSYTYTGLDKMYGYAGYKIFVYYMMAQKEL
jgi:GNAT superfamily N-acetyltransferase